MIQTLNRLISLVVAARGAGEGARPRAKSMTRAEFERQRQLLWVYLRHRGRCAVCGQEMSRDEAAAITPLPVALGIDQLLQIRLAHPRCEEREARGAERRAA